MSRNNIVSNRLIYIYVVFKHICEQYHYVKWTTISNIMPLARFKQRYCFFEPLSNIVFIRNILENYKKKIIYIKQNVFTFMLKIIWFISIYLINSSIIVLLIRFFIFIGVCAEARRPLWNEIRFCERATATSRAF
jgi:hypothetical protein